MRHPVTPCDFNFKDLFDLDKLQDIQDSLGRTTKLSLILTDMQGHPLTRPSNFTTLCTLIRRTEKGRANCIGCTAAMGRCSRKEPEIQRCSSGGLWIAGAPIHAGGRPVATWLIGQLRCPDTDPGNLLAYAGHIGADPAEVEKALNTVAVMSLDNFKDVSYPLFIIAGQVSEQASLKLNRQGPAIWNLRERSRLQKKNLTLQHDLDILKAKMEISRKKQSELQQKSRDLEARHTLSQGMFEHIEKERRQMEARLLQAQKMEAIGTLAGGIAHDFNNILFPVIGFSEMIMGDLPEKSPMRGQLQSVLEGAERAKNLVRQILTFCRETAQECRPLKLQLILNEALKLVRASFPSTIKIITRIPKETAMVRADPTQIHQIVMNLLTNALHAMEETGGSLTVSLRDIRLTAPCLPWPDMIPGGYVCLEVADTGCGMDASTIARMYEPYFTTKDSEKGTGLGLAVVQGIVKNLKGGIRVDSRPGNGTLFSVYLPQSVDQAEPEKITASSAQGLRGSERVLLVDDEKPVLRMAAQLLRRFGYDVHSYNSSLEALARFKASPHKFDIVITDLTMPGVTGEKLTAQVKAIRSDIPVILCTGFSQETASGKTNGLKPDKILMKPFGKDEMLQDVRMLLNNRICPVPEERI